MFATFTFQDPSELLLEHVVAMALKQADPKLPSVHLFEDIGRV